MYNLRPLLKDETFSRSLAAQVDHGELPLVLRSLKLKIISNCNLRCEMCRYWQIAKQQLSLEVIKQTLQSAASLDCVKVHLSGGEVTLHHDTTAAIAFGTSLGMRMNLTTNGILMDKARARGWIDAGLRAACLSLDGCRPKTHDRIRGVAGAYKRTVRAIRTLVRENGRLSGKLQVRINNVLSHRNLAELPDLIRLGGEMGVADVLPMPIDGKRGVRPSVEEIAWFNAEIAPRVAEMRRKYGMPLDADRIYPFGRTPQELQLGSEGKYGRGYYEQSLCYAPYLHAFVSHTGDVFACCMTRERMPSLGNVQTQSLRDIFLGEPYQNFRQQMKVKRLGVCGNCDQYLRENRLIEQGLAAQRLPLLTIAPVPSQPASNFAGFVKCPS